MKKPVNSFAQNVMYDGENLSYFFDITSIKVDAVPSITLNAIKIPGLAGEHYGSRELGSRTIKMTMSVKCKSRHPYKIYAAWRELMSKLLKDTPKPLYLDDDKYVNAIVTDISEIERIGQRGVAEVTFTASDPYFYGPTKTHQLKGVSSFTAMIQWPVWPIIKLSNCESPLMIVNMNTGDRVVIPDGISSSGKIVIDMADRRCSINGNFLPVSNELTNFFQIRPGENVISISSGVGELIYTERRL